MNCYKCGNPVDTGVKFCSKCGTPVTYDAPQNKGLVVFKRNFLYGYLFKMRLYIDNIKVGNLKNKSEIMYEVAYGRHEINGHLPLGKKSGMFIELSPEKSVAVIECWVSPSVGITGNVNFNLLEQMTY